MHTPAPFTGADLVSALNRLIADQFGPGHHASIARAPMFGNDDNHWIISGPRAQEIATGFAVNFHGTLERHGNTFQGHDFVSYSVTFPKS